MKFTVNRTELLAAAQKAERIAPRVSTIEILQCAYLQAEQDTLTVASGNLEIALEQQLPAQIGPGQSVSVWIVLDVASPTGAVGLGMGGSPVGWEWAY